MASYLMFYQPGVQVLRSLEESYQAVSSSEECLPISVWTMNGKWKAAANTMRHITLYGTAESWDILCQPYRQVTSMDEADLKEVKAEVRYHMRCAFFGTDCEEVQMVPVPVHAGYEEDTMACDLYHRFYVNTLNPCHNRVIRPLEVGQGSLINPPNWGGTNYLIRGLKGGRELKIKGHVLVAKTDQNGVVEEVERKDLGTISEMLVKVLWERQFNMVPEILGGYHVPRFDLCLDMLPLITVKGLISPTPPASFRPYTTREEAHLAGLHHSRVIPSRHLAAGLARSHADCQVSKHGQACVRVQISDRIRYLLDRWIPAIHMQDFLNALNRSGFSVTLRVVRNGDEKGELHTMDWSYDLNIVAPAGRAAECRAFFQSIGYDTWLSEEVACHYHGFASGMERGYMCREDGQSNEVTITEATGGVCTCRRCVSHHMPTEHVLVHHPLHLCAPLHNKVHGDAD
ncbi:hypothetical protein BKA70DRAFT_1242509 [Coprinopsis sp. MPI-PUGE-AT-0042]|nr:hypothetical protein BKA70DRAFT_1242509 [Coprinopsis sp. MPI-PUGE-AT-0042]